MRAVDSLLLEGGDGPPRLDFAYQCSTSSHDNGEKAKPKAKREAGHDDKPSIIEKSQSPRWVNFEDIEGAK